MTNGTVCTYTFIYENPFFKKRKEKGSKEQDNADSFAEEALYGVA